VVRGHLPGVSALENYQFFDNVATPLVGDDISFSFETLSYDSADMD